MAHTGHGTFCAAVNCMDGRTQLPVIEYMRKRFSTDFVDTITEPGPNRILAEGADKTALASIFRRLDISVGKHGSGAIAVVGHSDCAGNPRPQHEQIQDIREACNTVRRKYPELSVIGLWVELPSATVSEIET